MLFTIIILFVRPKCNSFEQWAFNWEENLINTYSRKHHKEIGTDWLRTLDTLEA